MSHRDRFARIATVAFALGLAFAMTPQADARGFGESRGGGGGHFSSSGGGRSFSSGGHSMGHSAAPTGGTRGWSGHSPRGSYSPRGYSGRGNYGGRWERGWGGRGYWGGGYGYPGWYSNWYWGFAPYWASYGWLWGWDGGWGWPWYWDPFWTDWRYVDVYGDAPYYGSVWAWRSRGGAWSGRFGRVKTDVEPDEAELWLNGKYIGTADDFDGYPDYLYLQPGTFHLEFRLKGYQTWATDVSLQRGELVRLKHELTHEKGHRLEFLPESKGMPSGRFFDASGNPVSPAARRPRARAIEDQEGPIGIDDRKDQRPRGDVRVAPDDEDEDQPPEGMTQERRRGESVRPQQIAPAKAWLRWKVAPEDAAVWVDDQYLGTGEELNARPRGTLSAAGKHTVTVVRPGYKSRTLEVEAKAGEPVDVVVELEK